MLQPLPTGLGVAIIGCNATKEKDEVKLNIWPAAHVTNAGEQAQSLTSSKMRMNIRGVIRVESGFTKKYIVDVEKSPLEAVVSMNAMQQSLGLSTVSDDVVVAALADRVFDAPMLGLALRRDTGDPLGAFRVLLLIQGTEDTEMDVLDDENE